MSALGTPTGRHANLTDAFDFMATPSNSMRFTIVARENAVAANVSEPLSKPLDLGLNQGPVGGTVPGLTV